MAPVAKISISILAVYHFLCMISLILSKNHGVVRGDVIAVLSCYIRVALMSNQVPDTPGSVMAFCF